MPNWVCAGFNVAGDQHELRRFTKMMIRPSAEVGMIARVGDPPPPTSTPEDAPGPDVGENRRFTLDFNGIIPSPPESASIDWEAWAVGNWGTKWNAQDVAIRVEPSNVWFQFMTPWDFPTPVFEALAIEFPGLVFSGSAYEESGEFELIGEFNGDDDWGPGEIEWVSFDDDDDVDGGGQLANAEGD